MSTSRREHPSLPGGWGAAWCEVSLALTLALHVASRAARRGCLPSATAWGVVSSRGSQAFVILSSIIRNPIGVMSLMSLPLVSSRPCGPPCATGRANGSSELPSPPDPLSDTARGKPVPQGVATGRVSGSPFLGDVLGRVWGEGCRGHAMRIWYQRRIPTQRKTHAITSALRVR